MTDPAAELMSAVHANDTSLVGELLQKHPALKKRLNEALPGHDFGAPPLIRAVQHGNRKLIGILLEAGADINARSDWWAGSFGVLDSAKSELVPFLLERGAIMDAHAAARLGRLDDLEKLVAANPTVVNQRFGDGQTPLHVAATVPIARFLLEHGAAIDVLDVDHESTPAQYAMDTRHDVARFLVSQGCKTDILMAAALGDIDLLRRFLDRDPESVRTAVGPEYFPMSSPRAGGTIYNWTLGGGMTAHQAARKFGHDAAFNLLTERSPSDVRLVVACQLEDQKAVDSLLKADPGLVSRLSDVDRRQLAEAASGNKTGVVRLMLAAGWPVNTTDSGHGATPLHWAAWHGNAAMVRDLLRYRPDVNARDRQYQGTPLDWSEHGAGNSWNRATGDYGAVREALARAVGTSEGAEP